MLRRGVALRLRHQDDAARVLFAEALVRCGCAEAEGQLALAEQAMGRWTEAETHLAEAVRATRDPWVARNRRELTQSLAQIAAHLGTLEVHCGVAGASVEVSEHSAGTMPANGTPVQVRAEPGTAAVRIHAEGYVDVVRQAEVTAGSVTRVDIALTPVPPLDPLHPVVTLAPLVVAPRIPSAPLASELRMLPARSVVHPVVYPAVYWLTGVAGAMLAGAVAAQTAQQVYVGQYNDDARCQVGGRTREDICGSIGRAADTAQWAATVGYIAGGGLALAAVVTALVSRRPVGTEQAVLTCGVAGEIGCHVRF